MALDGFVAGWEILGVVGVGEAGPGGVVAGFDGGEPGGLDGKAGGVVEIADESVDAGEDVGVEGSRGRRVCGNEVGWMGFGIVFGADREAPY